MKFEIQKSRKQETTFESAPDGIYTGIITQIIDLGLQETSWEGVPALKRQFRLAFELDENMSDGRPYSVYKTVNSTKLDPETKYLNSKSELAAIVGAALKKDSSKISPDDVENALGKAVQVTTRNGWVAKHGISALNPKLPIPERKNDLLLYDTENPNPEVFAKLTEKLQTKIREGIQRKEKLKTEEDAQAPQF